MEKISYKLEVFEGPLDLLLHLISKNKLNIYDIPVAELLEQYMEHIEKMKEADMDIASEFLEMAAYLVYLKTVSLLPKHEEEAKTLKGELTGQLLELQAVREAADRLAESISFDTFVREPAEIEFDETYKGTIELTQLKSAYFAAVGRGKRRLPPPETVFNKIVKKKVVSVSSKIIYVLKRLWKEKRVKFEAVFENAGTKSELVAIFLAILELVKGKRVKVTSTAKGDTIQLVTRKTD